MYKISLFPVRKPCSHAATNGSDYLGVSMDFVFPAGSISGTQQCINITIIDNSTVDEDETFTVTLSTSDPRVKLDNNVTTVTILDIDLECVYYYKTKVLYKSSRSYRVNIYQFLHHCLLTILAINYMLSDQGAKGSDVLIDVNSTIVMTFERNFWILLYNKYNYTTDLIPTISLPLQLSVNEDIPEVQVCATLDTSSINEIDINVTLATSDGTGTYVQNLTVSCEKTLFPCSYKWY